MRVLVSACALGENCKYNGKNNLNENLVQYLSDKQVIRICPEMLANMKTPRPCAELVNGKVMQENGENVDFEYRYGVKLALKKIETLKIDLVILQSRSPTCGVNQIYDGSFSGNLIKGSGIFAQALIEKGYTVKDAGDYK